ncbi:hypothetical protein [Streptomyces sp. NPDC020298]|uniref:hypothetical protein n=1 Tax=unclassified Streptomyces TaxID=2593676 RepID=UPI0033CE612D
MTAAHVRTGGQGLEKTAGGALDVQRAFGDLGSHRSELLGVHDDVDDGTAYAAELFARVDQPGLSDEPILLRDLLLPDSW